MPYIISYNCSPEGRDVGLPTCPKCKITYTVYECGCYQMSEPIYETDCSTCVQWRPEDLKPEPTSIPLIIANVINATCGNEDCIRISKLPTCTEKRGFCTTRFMVYACGEIERQERFSSSCKLCRPWGHFYPATRPILRTAFFGHLKQPKLRNVCGNYYEHEKQRRDRQDAAEMARRTAEHEDKGRYEQDRKLQGTSNTSKAGKQHAPVSQAYGFPAPTYSGQQYAPPRLLDPQAYDSPAPTYSGQQYAPPRWPGPQAYDSPAPTYSGQQYAPPRWPGPQAYDSPAPTYSGQQYAPPRWPGPQAPGPSHYR